MNWTEIIERVFAIIGFLNVLTIVIFIIFALLSDPIENYPKRISKEKFERVSRRRKIL